jgi:hypothetical protein
MFLKRAMIEIQMGLRGWDVVLSGVTYGRQRM